MNFWEIAELFIWLIELDSNHLCDNAVSTNLFWAGPLWLSVMFEVM